MKAEIRHKGHRYWANFTDTPWGIVWFFWSDHVWPFYHGHYAQRTLDRREAYEQFLKWLPFTPKIRKNDNEIF